MNKGKEKDRKLWQEFCSGQVGKSEYDNHKYIISDLSRKVKRIQ